MKNENRMRNEKNYDFSKSFSFVVCSFSCVHRFENKRWRMLVHESLCSLFMWRSFWCFLTLLLFRCSNAFFLGGERELRIVAILLWWLCSRQCSEIMFHKISFVQFYDLYIPKSNWIFVYGREWTCLLLFLPKDHYFLCVFGGINNAEHEHDL